mgnify:FL=1
MKKVLIITYYWPPSGGAGVQRWLKFVKYLRNFGWEPLVYTASNPEYPVADFTLEKDIPANLEVLKTRVWEPYDIYKKFIGLKKGDKINAAFLTEKKKPKLTEKIAVWIRGNFFIPDARKFWIKPSIRFLADYLKKNPVDAIVSTGPPHSMHRIALGLKTKFDIPWMADFRDPWTKIDYYNDLNLTGFADRRHKKMELETLQMADRVVVISEGMKREFQEIFMRDYEVITNGFDEDDLPKILPEPDKKFSVAHIGSLVKTRNPDILWKVLHQLAAERPAFAADLEIKLVGKVDYFVTQSIEKYSLTSFVRKIDYLPHTAVIEEQLKSQVLLLLINNTPNAKSILTGKFFEYMAARRPILCIGPPDGDAAGIIHKTNCGLVSGFEDEIGLRNNVLRFFTSFTKGDTDIDNRSIDDYSRIQLTQKLSQLLDSAVAKS